MKLISFISDFSMPFLAGSIIFYGWYRGIHVFDVFVKGARRGVKIAVEMLPSLIGLMAAVRLFRDSGLLDFLTCIIVPIANAAGLPAAIIPLVIVKFFSASAATGIMLDLFRQFGPDSEIGFLAAVISSTAETVLFVMSIYLTHVKVEKSSYILPGALISTFAGIIASVAVVSLIF